MYFVKDEEREKYYFKTLVYLKFNVNPNKMTNSNTMFDSMHVQLCPVQLKLKIRRKLRTKNYEKINDVKDILDF